MSNFNFNYICTENTITVSYEKKHYQVSKEIEPERYGELRKAIQEKNSDAFIDALIPKVRIVKYAHEYFEVDDNGIMYFKDRLNEQIPEVIAKRILSFLDDNLPIEPLVNFWKNLRKNPSQNSKNMLYEFLEKNHHPITPEGYFIAYKKVTKQNGKLVDSHTHTFDNSVGLTVVMDRKDVVEDKHTSCAPGLHVASWEYAQSFSGTVLIEVLVNPENVVSVPSDYKQQKMRCCEYTVIDIISESGTDNKKYSSPIKDNLVNVKKPVHQSNAKNEVVNLHQMTAKEIVDYVKEKVGVVITTNLKNKKQIIKQASKILASN